MSKITWFKKGYRQTHGRTDTTDFIAFLANVVGDKGVIHPDSTLRSVHITLTELN